MKARELAWGAMLIALAMLIPIAFAGVLTVAVPPYFTATLASHVPSMLSILLGPAIAILVGVGSTLGFLIKLGLPIVTARAAMHCLFGGVGAYIYKRGVPLWRVLLFVLPIHALAESVVVLLFGRGLKEGLLITGLGTAAHHAMDMAITLSVVRLGRLESLLGRPS